MNAKYILMFALGALVAAGLGAYAFYKPDMSPNGENPTSIPSAKVAEFSEAVRSKVIIQIGQPIEGFEPFMFMQVYPGLIAQDFENVDALIGLYRYQNGQVVYDLNGEQELHSAARAISDKGMEQLFGNILARVSMPAGTDPVQGVLDAISASPGPDPTNNTSEPGISTTVRGQIACLPHKGDGPHTMECAIGVRADNGKYYALTNFSYPEDGDVQERLEITGRLVTPNQFQEKYDIVGTIEVERATRL
jgi:hypothetical protein